MSIELSEREDREEDRITSKANEYVEEIQRLIRDLEGQVVQLKDEMEVVEVSCTIS